MEITKMRGMKVEEVVLTEERTRKTGESEPERTDDSKGSEKLDSTGVE
jgi:hypothetical protein